MEAPLEATAAGLVPGGPGWFVLDARKARWIDRGGRGQSVPLTGWTEAEKEALFPQLGVNIVVVAPGQPTTMYHHEGDQEGYLVLAGTALLIVEGQERPLAQWDYVHLPPGTGHSVVGTGEGPCVIVAVGARTHDDSTVYAVDPAAQRHGAGIEDDEDPAAPYARFAPPRPTAYREGTLPGG